MKRFISATPRCEIVVATKDIVDALLAMNASNRPLRKSHVEFLRRQIAQDEFCITNQGIGVDVNGVVFDGQHRLVGLSEAGYPSVELLVVYGLPTKSRAAVDIGLKRSMADLMQFAFGHPEATASSMAVARAWGIYTIYDGGVTKTIPHEVAEWYITLLPAIERCFAIPSASRQPAPVIAAICSRLHRHIHDDRPLLFLEKLISGAELNRDSPVLALRNWLVKSTAPGMGLARERFNKTSTALIAFLEERTLTKLYSRAEAAKALARVRRQDPPEPESIVGR